MKKVSNILLKIFAYGILACLFAGGLSLVGYLIGLIVGGENAENLCTWIFKTYLPWVIKATSIFTGLGLIGMYLSGQVALTVSENKQKKEKH